MKPTRLIGLCLLTTTLAAAVAAASASAALPEFTAPFPKTFTVASNGSLFETAKGTKVKCLSDVASGEVTGEKTGTIQIIFKECASKKVPCNTPGVPPGEIPTAMLSFTVGYINKSATPREVGIDLLPSAGGPFMEYACGSAVNGIVIGSVIGRITPINKKVTPPKFFPLKFKQTAGTQLVQNLEGEPKDTLETSFSGPGGPFEATGLTSVEKISFGEIVSLIA